MEVQPSVVHLDHGTLQSQSQMGYVQRNPSLHSNIRTMLRSRRKPKDSHEPPLIPVESFPLIPEKYIRNKKEQYKIFREMAMMASKKKFTSEKRTRPAPYPQPPVSRHTVNSEMSDRLARLQIGTVEQPRDGSRMPVATSSSSAAERSSRRRAPAGGSTVHPPAGGSTVHPPAGGSTVHPPAGGSTAHPPAAGYYREIDGGEQRRDGIGTAVAATSSQNLMETWSFPVQPTAGYYNPVYGYPFWPCAGSFLVRPPAGDLLVPPSLPPGGYSGMSERGEEANGSVAPEQFPPEIFHEFCQFEREVEKGRLEREQQQRAAQLADSNNLYGQQRSVLARSSSAHPVPGPSGVRQAVYPPYQQQGGGRYNQPSTSYAPPPPPPPLPQQQQPPQPPQPSQQHQQPQQYRDGGNPYRPSQVPIAPDPGQPFKKIRVHDPKPDLQQPLRIDVREPSGAYTPQTEAISPTPTSDDGNRATKEDLLQEIHKVDRDIAQTEHALKQLEIRKVDLEEVSKQPPEEEIVETKTDSTITKSRHQSHSQQIYADNRKKAVEAHNQLGRLGPSVEIPLYNQPSDTPNSKEATRRNNMFKNRLALHLSKKAQERHEQERKVAVTYSQLNSEWNRKVEKIENSAKRRVKDAKNRDLFEKMFPELRKQREDKERFNRVGARVKSEADMEEIMDGLHEQEMEEKKMRSYAIIPPMMLDPQARKHRYINNNSRVEDLSKEFKDRAFFNCWTPQENEIFKERYLQHPKNFGIISSYLEKKSTGDCVQQYYLTKKHENFKQLLRKSRQGRTRAGRNNPAASKVPQPAPVPEVAAPGVTTRLQREQLQKQDPVPSTSGVSAPAAAATAPAATTRTVTPPSATATATTPSGSTTPQPPPRELSPPSGPPQLTPIAGPSSAPDRDMEISREVKQEMITQQDKDNEIETSDEELVEVNGRPGPHNCAICNSAIDSIAHSRHLPPSQAFQYGLTEKDIPSGARVCNSCRCKSVRSRCMVCPLPTCPNAKGVVKRLRTVPSKWAVLAPHVLEPIVRDFKIPTGTSKCCSTCYARISRRLAPFIQPEEDSTRWTDAEIETLQSALRQNGTQWLKVAEMLPGRTPQQCKIFYFNSRKKYNLDAIVREFAANAGEDRKPAVTDEEESGSSTSSCDEQPVGGVDTSDTASAGSPAKHTDNHPSLPGKEPARVTEPRTHAGDRDYDSSATRVLQETADEGQTTDSHVYSHLPGTSITAVNGPPSLSPPRTVKDLMGTVIEKQLMKSPGGVPTACTGPPTISSILGTDPAYKRSPCDALATLSLVNNIDLGMAPLSPIPGPDVSKEGLVVVQMPQGLRERREPEPETLDLSIKKRDNPGGYASASSVQHFPYTLPSHSKSSASIYQRDPHYYAPQTSKPPTLQTPHLVMSHSRAPHIPKVNKQGPPPGMPKLSPKMLPTGQSSKPGSITHGTPVQGGPRYDAGMLRQIQQTQHKETGSITQGTPVHHIIPNANDKRQNMSYDYYKRAAPVTTTTGFSSPFPPNRQPTSYPLEQQLSSRQIIINDYITSQQMHGPRRVTMQGNEKGDGRQMSQLFYSAAPGSMYLPSRSSVESATPPPLRQGVIQRHNTIPPSTQSQGRVHSTPPSGKVHYPPPGHEAFSSLVEAAVQQPSLPVPSADKKHLSHRESHHEGLGKTMADSISSSRMLEHGRMSTNPAAEQQRLRQNHERERERIMSQREQEQRYQREREQRESHHQQLQLQMQRQQQARLEQQRMEQQNQQARMEQQARIDYDKSRMEQQRMEAARLEQAGQARIDYEAKQQRHQQQLAAFMDAQQRATTEREREKDWDRDRDREATRILMGNYQRERMQQAAARAAAESPSPNRGTPGAGQRTEDSAMTAASLIDAIITHQINQTSEAGPTTSQTTGPSQTRPGDRLFQGFLREGPPQHSESNGKLSPMKRAGSPLEREPIKNISLADHIDSIISKDYNMTFPHSFNLPQDGMNDQQNWKIRRPGNKEAEAPRDRSSERPERAERSDRGERPDRSDRPERAERVERDKSDERQIIRMAQAQPSSSKPYHEPMSPPDQWSNRYYPEKPSHLSPLDYVKNRIVEVMRTSEDKESDEKSKESGSPTEATPDEGAKGGDPPPTSSAPPPTSSSFSYPYASMGVHGGMAPRSPTPAKSVDEQPPILSAQYDPLSDEDD